MKLRIYRWDLDKTYLETDFSSVRGLVRTALEPAVAKRSVPGARALLGALSSRADSRICILSGSPTQMRRVLSEKLSIDGIRFDELELKDNIGNLKRGRVRALREQVGYKLPALLEGRGGMGAGATELLFGDDAEVDALVYAVYADAVAGRISETGLRRFMVAAGAYEDQVDRAVAALDEVGTSDPVERIFIHLDRGLPAARFSLLGSRVVPVHSWFQAALVLVGRGDVEPGKMRAIVEDVEEGAGIGPRQLANLTQDIVRRGHLGKEEALGLVEGGEWADNELKVMVHKRLETLDKTNTPIVASLATPPDYVALVKEWPRRD